MSEAARVASFIVRRIEVIRVELHGCSYLTCQMPLLSYSVNGAVEGGLVLQSQNVARFKKNNNAR